MSPPSQYSLHYLPRSREIIYLVASICPFVCLSVFTLMAEKANTSTCNDHLSSILDVSKRAQTDIQTDGHYQVHYLPAWRSILSVRHSVSKRNLEIHLCLATICTREKILDQVMIALEQLLCIFSYT